MEPFLDRVRPRVEHQSIKIDQHAQQLFLVFPKLIVRTDRGQSWLLLLVLVLDQESFSLVPECQLGLLVHEFGLFDPLVDALL